MKNGEKISDSSPQLNKVPILVETFHGGFRIFQLQVLLDLSCTRCWWFDMFLTMQEFFRYKIRRKNHFRLEQSVTATNWRIIVLFPVLLDPSRVERIRWVQAQGYVKFCAQWRLCETANRAFFSVSPRHFNFLDCNTETSKRFECERETFRLLHFKP